jgi:murein DD-endopeptidase MepM/ murein hydrolase activator NlpD
MQKDKSLFLYISVILIIFWLAVGIFLFFHKDSKVIIYAYPENPKQGDAVLIKVENGSDNITGKFENEDLVFYKKPNSTEYFSFLGIDVDQKSGDYKIIINISGKELTKEIKVSQANFSEAKTAQAPNYKQTGVTTEKAVSNLMKNDNPAINKVLSDFTLKPYFNDSFSFPLNKMEVSGFNFGRFINFSKYKLQHLGVDLRAGENTNVYAINDGKIVATLNLPNYGNIIIIDHGLKIFSMYLHLSEFKVADGDIVKRGQIIGLSGETGYATAPHLHFSMRVDGARIDPMQFIEITKKMDNNYGLADIYGGFLNIFK